MQTHTHPGTILQIYELNLSDWNSYIQGCTPSLPRADTAWLLPESVSVGAQPQPLTSQAPAGFSMATAGALFVWLFLEFLPLNIAFWIYLLTHTKEEQQQDENETEQNRRDRQARSQRVRKLEGQVGEGGWRERFSWH